MAQLSIDSSLVTTYGAPSTVYVTYEFGVTVSVSVQVRMLLFAIFLSLSVCAHSSFFFFFLSPTLAYNSTHLAQLFDKTATRLPESMWVLFNPIVASNQWKLQKLASLIDPLDVMINGSRVWFFFST